ncbi:MAG TPA: POTRA domain-containing protein [Candidatus Acidoferrum sp.]|nr:POTRA domain-containing protein [Candidatus Acidoferrum sp.]
MRLLRSILLVATFGVALSPLFSGRAAAIAQTPPPAETATAALRQISATGLKLVPESAVLTLSGLTVGAQVGRTDLQAAADRLLQTGLFAGVNYNFKTRDGGVSIEFQLQEAPRLPVYFDNLPWLADSELTEAITRKLPFYDGLLPTAGTILDQATDAVSALLVARGLNLVIEHQLVPNPLGEGDVLQFHAQGASMQIASLTFSDPTLTLSNAIQQHLAEIEGHEYSRAAIELFLAEQIRPFYLQQGKLRVKLGPPEVRLTGNPNQKLPERIPVFIPVNPGPIFQWKGAQWHGNSALSEAALNGLLGAKIGATANGMDLEAGWERIREQYGQKGFLEVKIDATPSYDDAARTISYAVSIEEGPVYKFGKLVLSGVSLEAEKRLKQSWPMAPDAVFDKAVFEEFLTKLEVHHERIFGDLPLHYDSVGHWLQTDPKQGTVDVLLDFKH